MNQPKLHRKFEQFLILNRHKVKRSFHLFTSWCRHAPPQAVSVLRPYTIGSTAESAPTQALWVIPRAPGHGASLAAERPYVGPSFWIVLFLKSDEFCFPDIDLSKGQAKQAVEKNNTTGGLASLDKREWINLPSIYRVRKKHCTSPSY